MGFAKRNWIFHYARAATNIRNKNNIIKFLSTFRCCFFGIFLLQFIAFFARKYTRKLLFLSFCTHPTFVACKYVSVYEPEIQLIYFCMSCWLRANAIRCFLYRKLSLRTRRLCLCNSFDVQKTVLFSRCFLCSCNFRFKAIFVSLKTLWIRKLCSQFRRCFLPLLFLKHSFRPTAQSILIEQVQIYWTYSSYFTLFATRIT